MKIIPILGYFWLYVVQIESVLRASKTFFLCLKRARPVVHSPPKVLFWSEIPVTKICFAHLRLDVCH